MGDIKNTFTLFYLRTGNGHLAPAKALAKELERRGYQTTLIDGLEESHTIFYILIVWAYRQSIRWAIWCFEILYILCYIVPIRHFLLYLIRLGTYPYLKNTLMKNRDGTVVILHHLLIRPILYTIKKNNLDIKPIVLVTDPFSTHEMWFEDKTLEYITQSHKVVKRHPVQYKRFPFILDEKFISHDLKQTQCKEELGIDPNRKIVLLIGGGDGLPKGIRILKTLLRSRPDYKIIYITGNNRAQLKHAQKIINRYSSDVTVEGFVDNIEKYLVAADITITKAGASTIAETLTTQTVPIIVRYIWKHEKGNKDYIVENSLGFYQRNYRKIPSLLSELFSNKDLYDNKLNRIKELEIPNGASAIADYLITSNILSVDNPSP